MLKYQPKESSTVKEHFVNKIINKSHQRWPSKGMTGSSNNFQTSIWDDCQIKYFFKSQLDSVFVLSFAFFSYFTLRFAPDPGWLHTLTRTKPGWQTSNLEIDWRVVVWILHFGSEYLLGNWKPIYVVILIFFEADPKLADILLHLASLDDTLKSMSWSRWVSSEPHEYRTRARGSYWMSCMGGHPPGSKYVEQRNNPQTIGCMAYTEPYMEVVPSTFTLE